MLDLTPTSRTSVGRPRLSSPGRRGAGWLGFVLVLLGWVGVGVAHLATGPSPDPASLGAVLRAVGLSCISLAAIGGGTAVAVAAARSPMRRVFHSRPLFVTAVGLLTFAASALAVLIIRSPFDGIAAYGLPLADLINAFTLAAGALICVVGGAAAVRAAWSARRDERTWGLPATGPSRGRRRSRS